MPENLNETKNITFDRLEEDYKKALNVDFDINNDKIVFFSDIHKGTKKKNDAFRQNELIYCIALDHYFNEGYKLVQVGDIEEGWGFRIKKALNVYKDSVLKFESKFVNVPDRYYRVYGNHDNKWRDPDKVDSILTPRLTENPEIKIVVKPSLKLGENIAVFHGQQGSIESDLFWKVSKGFVRFFTSIFFRTFGRKKRRAANNDLVRHERDFLLNLWATEKKKLLIAGHTHRYLFGDKHSLRSFYDNILKLKNKPADELSDIEKILVDENINEYKDQIGDRLEKLRKVVEDSNINENCYFNIGAGIYSEGISCIEIDKGIIKLMFWPNSRLRTKIFINVLTNNPMLQSIIPETIFSEKLTDVFRKIGI